MIKKNRDSKFVIYQVLYIFVITVLAIKGANLDLGEVVSKDKALKVSVRDSLMAVIDSLNALGLKFDLKVQQDYSAENAELKKKVMTLSKSVTMLSEKASKSQETLQANIAQKPETKATIKDDSPMQSPLAESQSFIQNTWNIAKNKGNLPAQILDPASRNLIANVGPGEEKKFDLSNQKEVIIRFGSREQKIPVMPKRPPEIKIEAVSSKMNGSEIYVQDLQKTTVYKVTIVDVRPDQLQITYSGPVSVSGPVKDSKGNLVYNVSLKIASNEQRFDEWIDRTKPLKDGEGRYKVNFFFLASDKVTKEKVQVGDSFFFTSFSR
ncbi:MAG: hypothetical protein Q8933_10035 [Bacteroidota bacterium]|nr:hypothetical protein [Bacteroidota bacterium]MDP4192811.1 hypothetical protein [Bacteroidota bacterium]MDP4194620.1 hypothetical protein [Bacteroidota bacterium]